MFGMSEKFVKNHTIAATRKPALESFPESRPGRSTS